MASALRGEDRTTEVVTESWHVNDLVDLYWTQWSCCDWFLMQSARVGERKAHPELLQSCVPFFRLHAHPTLNITRKPNIKFCLLRNGMATSTKRLHGVRDDVSPLYVWSLPVSLSPAYEFEGFPD